MMAGLDHRRWESACPTGPSRIEIRFYCANCDELHSVIGEASYGEIDHKMHECPTCNRKMEDYDG